MQDLDLIFRLVKPTRSSGGDRYEAEMPPIGNSQQKPWTVYFLQTITRAYGEPRKKLRVIVHSNGGS